MDYHQPALLRESIEGLNIKPDGIYVDVTFGGGGHSREIIKHLTTGKLISFDQDKDAQQNIIKDDRFIFVAHNFKFLKNFLRYHNYPQVDGILADLGVSSHHFDAPERGFSFRFDGNLDMRMNQNAKTTAADILNTYDTEKLTYIFKVYGEIKNPFRLVKLIEKERTSTPFTTINHFNKTIEELLPKFNEHKYLAKIYQAIRIEVNHELDILQSFIQQSVDCLNPQGRLAVITYHSLEDRLVKNFIKNGKFEGQAEKDIYGRTDVPFKAVNRKVITATEQELEENNRARSAKLRVAERI